MSCGMRPGVCGGPRAPVWRAGADGAGDHRHCGARRRGHERQRVAGRDARQPAHPAGACGGASLAASGLSCQANLLARVSPPSTKDARGLSHRSRAQAGVRERCAGKAAQTLVACIRKGLLRMALCSGIPGSATADRVLRSAQLVRVADDNGIRFPREFGLLLKQLLYFDRYTRLLAPKLSVLSDDRITRTGRPADPLYP